MIKEILGLTLDEVRTRLIEEAEAEKSDRSEKSDAEKEMEAGLKIEKEHLKTLETVIDSVLSKCGGELEKADRDEIIKTALENTVKNHMEEFPNYYTAPNGLLAMEKALKKESKSEKSPSESESDSESSSEKSPNKEPEAGKESVADRMARMRAMRGKKKSAEESLQSFRSHRDSRRSGSSSRRSSSSPYDTMSKWCQCDEPGESDFKDDGECSCGVEKHHYHCTACGKLTQIG